MVRNVTKKATLSELRTREFRNVAYNSRRKRVVGDVHTLRMGRENEKDKDGSRESVEQRRKEKEECRIINLNRARSVEEVLMYTKLQI